MLVAPYHPWRRTSLQPPEDSTDLRSVIDCVIEAERKAIATYQKLAQACDGVDFVTQDLAIELLADEEEHLCLFEGFRKSLEGPR